LPADRADHPRECGGGKYLIRGFRAAVYTAFVTRESRTALTTYTKNRMATFGSVSGGSQRVPGSQNLQSLPMAYSILNHAPQAGQVCESERFRNDFAGPAPSNRSSRPAGPRLNFILLRGGWRIPIARRLGNRPQLGIVVVLALCTPADDGARPLHALRIPSPRARLKPASTGTPFGPMYEIGTAGWSRPELVGGNATVVFPGSSRRMGAK